MKAARVILAGIEIALIAFIGWGGKLVYDDYFRIRDYDNDYIVIALLATVLIEAIIVWHSQRLHALVALLLQDHKRMSQNSLLLKTLPLSLFGGTVLGLLCLIVGAKSARYIFHFVDYMSQPYSIILNLGVVSLVVLVPTALAHFVVKRIYRHK